MARPRLKKRPTKVNLSLDPEVKRMLYRIACDRGMTMSAAVGALVREAKLAEQVAA